MLNEYQWNPKQPLNMFPLQLDSALKRMYNYLQRFAVGLEVMVEDQAMYDGDFIMEFNEAEYKLKAVSKNAQSIVGDINGDNSLGST